MKKSERGAVTIEATLCLTAFIFAIVTLLSAVDVCLAQARISVAIDATAKEISQYSYLYGLTGLNEIKAELKNQGASTEAQIDNTMKGINNVFNAIQSIGDTGTSTDITDPSEVTSAFNKIKGEAGSIKQSASDLKGIMEGIKDDPKSFIFGIAKLAASDALDYATSRLIAEPIATAMVQKHLKNTDTQETEQFLKKLRIVPDASGSHLGGLDFSESSLFMYGSDEIRIVVKYKIKIIPLLPINTEYSFRQVAVTKGWLGGDGSGAISLDEAIEIYMKENSSLWTDAGIEERASYIRSRTIAENPGYYNLKGKYTYADAYSPTQNDFMMVTSANFLYSEKGAATKKVSDITDKEIQEVLDKHCDRMNAELDGINSIAYSKDGQKIEQPVEPGYTKTLYLVVPEDAGLKERIETYADNYKSGGVNIVVVSGYGNGANATEVTSQEQNQAVSN